MNLGHTQRGGVPTAYDRTLGQRYGLHAIDMVHQKKWGRIAVLKGLDITDITIKEAIATNRRLDQRFLRRDRGPGSEGSCSSQRVRRSALRDLVTRHWRRKELGSFLLLDFRS